MILDVGRHLGVPAGVYHADPCPAPSLSRSIASLICNASPLHAWYAHPRLNPEFEPVVDERFELGTVVHSVFLEGQAAVEVVDADSWRTNAAQDARDAARAAGRIPLLADQWPAVVNAVTAVRERMLELDVDPPVFRDGTAEEVIVWNERAAWCRARPDWLRSDLATIDDLKSTSASADPRRWARSLFDRGYDVQAEFYARGVEAVTGERPAFRFVVVEVKPPHAVSVLRLGPDAEVLARKKVDYALEVWARCLESGRWPSYSSREALALLPAYEESRWLEVELEFENTKARAKQNG